MSRSNAKFGLVLLTGVVLGVAGTQVLHAQQEMQRAELQRFDLTGVNGTEVIMGVLDIAPGTTIARHIHYGDEFAYVLQGGMIERPAKHPRN